MMNEMLQTNDTNPMATLPTQTPLVFCYEAGRDGFYPRRRLTEVGHEVWAIDSASIEVSRRQKQARSDRIDDEALAELVQRRAPGEATMGGSVRMLLLALAWLVTGCTGAPGDFYPLETGRSWTYRMEIRQGDGGAGRLIEATSVVVNLPERAFAGGTVVPQRSEAFNTARIRLIRDDGESVAEVGEAIDPAGPAIAREPVNPIIRRPLTVGASWSSTWETTRSGSPMLLPMQKTVTATDGSIDVAAGRFDGCLGLGLAGGGTVTTGEGPLEVIVTGEEWFARDVGLVRAIFREDVPGRPEAATRVDMVLVDRQL